MEKFDWAIVGGGITGIALSEILTREGYSVVMIEKNEKLAGETTRDFHEWIHTGSLYTLIPDNLKTLKFILGAIDDLLEYYSSFDRMNVKPTTSGLNIDTSEPGWFNPNYIHFKYRIKNRKFTFPWLIGVARSVTLIEKIKKHDWLRRRAGEIEPFKRGRIKNILKLTLELIRCKEKFYTVRTPDFTTNSRVLLRDVVATALKNGLKLSLGNNVTEIKNEGSLKIIKGVKESFLASKVVVCAGDSIDKFAKVKVSTSYAPMAVVSNISSDSKSFVELDYYPQNCINLITKSDGMGLAGGISFKQKSKCDAYLDRVLEEHKLRDVGLKEVTRYIGVKTEITFENHPRNYLYHIVPIEDNLWIVIPGKFTLGFSLAPEFFRKVYNRNPKKTFATTRSNQSENDLVSETVWFDNKLNK